MKLNRFAWYCWGVLGVNLLVILWGAFVRVTGAGAGCGSHWPTCNGEVIPWNPAIETQIEFFHRLTSGAALLLVVGMLVWAYRNYPKGSSVRLGAGWSMTIMIIEALLGAGLVLFGLVADNQSPERAVVMGIHLVNTFLLIGAITLTGWWASGGPAVRLRGHGWWGAGLWAGFIGMLILGASGAITALGDTLFPASSLAEGIAQDFSPTAHFLIQLRIFHPLIAIGLGVYLAYYMNAYANHLGSSQLKRTGQFFGTAFFVQVLIGSFNVILLAPAWIQLVHLFVADILLITLVLFMAQAFTDDREREKPLPQTTTPTLVTQ